MSNSTLYVAAPEGHSWPISLDAAAVHLRNHWPDAHVSRQVSAVTGKPYLSFDVVVDGMARRGTYSEHPHCLTLSDGRPGDWAETIVWFLSLLPKGAQATAMADGDFRLVPIPPDASVQEITQLYERLWA
jgi:hypothetical protein